MGAGHRCGDLAGGGIDAAPVTIPPRTSTGRTSNTIAELKEGWAFFRTTTWLWVVVLAFGVINALHSGAWATLGPLVAQDTIGRQGWGYVLSAEAVGLLLTSIVMLRMPIRRPLLAGMLCTALYGIPVLVIGSRPELGLLVLAAFIAGAGIEIFGIGWSLAMQENIDETMLSRAFSYDMLGSLIAVPVGQLAAGPVGTAFGYQSVQVASGLAIVAVSLLTLLSGSVRRLPRRPTPVPRPAR